MSVIIRFQKLRPFTRFIVILCFFFILSNVFIGCGTPEVAVNADLGLKRSETEFGGGATGLVGTELPNESASVYGLVGYHIYSFEGGHDNLLQLGVQGRKTVGEEKKLWLGAEAGWVQDKSIYEYAEWGDPTSNGLFLGALGGYKLPVNDLDLSVFGGLTFMGLGDFKADEHVVEPGHNSIQLKIGLDLVLPFSK